MAEENSPPIEILGKTYEHRLADGEYDAVFFGTGLKECILAGLLAVRGWKVLQLDRNSYYGGECASLNLEELYAHYKKPYDAKQVEAKFGPPRRFCVDLVPKFLMANGNIVKMLLQTGVTRYIDFQGIAGSYVMAQSMFGKGTIYRVPVTPAEAIKSSLVGALQKRSLMNFATWLDKYQGRDKSADPKIEGATDEEFVAMLNAYFSVHNPDKVKDIPVLLDTYKGRRLAMVSDLERKYQIPFVPIETDVVFQTGPMGLRIDGVPFKNTGSVKVKSAVRVIGFQNAADGSQGQGEKSGCIKVGDFISKIAGQSVLGLSDAEVTKKLQEAARPVTVAFMRPCYHESEDATSTDPTKKDLRKVTMADLYTYFGLDENSQTFIGHAMALETSDAYIQKPAEATVEKIQLYGRSVGRYGQNSPYLYPMYGLSTLPEGFSRLAAINGGTVMLRTTPDEVLFDPATGKVAGVRVGERAAKCRFVIGEASYFPQAKSKVVKKVARSICILKHPIKDTSGGDSAQIILPSKTLKNKQHDIYISCVSSFHQVATKDVYICICSTVAESANPIQELEPAFALLGEIDERFDSVTEVRGPVDLASKDNMVICEGLDETSHFESATEDILNVYRRVFGKGLDLNEKLVEDQPTE